MGEVIKEICSCLMRKQVFHWDLISLLTRLSSAAMLSQWVEAGDSQSVRVFLTKYHSKFLRSHMSGSDGHGQTDRQTEKRVL